LERCEVQGTSQVTLAQQDHRSAATGSFANAIRSNSSDVPSLSTQIILRAEYPGALCLTPSKATEYNHIMPLDPKVPRPCLIKKMTSTNMAYVNAIQGIAGLR
jgi:hypothetical protein